MVNISIIIPTFKREAELIKCIANIYYHLELSDEIEIIVSNDSLEQTINKFINNKYPKVSVINGPRKGPAANRNYAAKQAKGDWLIFLDDDCLPQQNWLLSYELAIKNNTGLVLEGKTIANKSKTRYDEVAPININGGKLWSCNFAIQKKLFFSLNGFDENYPFSTMEDIDFKERLKLITQFQFIENSLVIHPWRRRVAFKNFKLRIQSQRYFAKKFNQKNIFQFRIKRIKIFVGSIFSNLKELAQYRFKGWLCYLDKMVFNFIMIFI
jgi:glycosyltransferase involved in cell wall biosynthesis